MPPVSTLLYLRSEDRKTVMIDLDYTCENVFSSKCDGKKRCRMEKAYT